MQGIPQVPESQQSVSMAPEKPKCAREKQKRGTRSRATRTAGLLCLPLQTILRANSRVCVAESAIFAQVSRFQALASSDSAFNKPLRDAKSNRVRYAATQQSL
jgi:hypothetical protein